MILQTNGLLLLLSLLSISKIRTMAILVFEVQNLISDDEDFCNEIMKHYGVIIFGYKSQHLTQQKNQKKKKVPFLYIPTQDLTTKHLYPEQLSKVEYGSIGTGGNYIKFTFFKRPHDEEMSLMIILSSFYMTKFIEKCTKILPHSKKPQLISEKTLKSQPFFAKAMSMFSKYEAKIEASRNVAKLMDSWKITLYANYMSEHYEIKKPVKKVKQLLRDDAPKFISSYCPASGHEFWLAILNQFIADHRCNLQLRGRCRGFSLQKCCRCRVARYCSTQCQLQDWTQHSSGQCDYWRERFKSELFIGEAVETILKERLPKKAQLSIHYDGFHSLVSSSVFDASLNIIRDKHFIQRMMKEADGNDISYKCFKETFGNDISKINILLREEPKSREVILKQLDEAWGKHRLFNPPDNVNNSDTQEVKKLRQWWSVLTNFVGGGASNSL